MSTLISVTASAEERIDPELGAVRLTVGASGPKRDDVVARGNAAHARLLAEVRRLEASGVLDRWSAGQLRVWSRRPFNTQGKQLPLVHESRGEVELVFSDLEALSVWVSGSAAGEDLSVDGVDWRITDATRDRVRELAQRRAVVEAVAKAGVYASALGLGTPSPVELADTGLLDTRPSPAPMMLARSVGMVDSGGPTTEFVPAPLVIQATVEARFTADPA